MGIVRVKVLMWLNLIAGTIQYIDKW